MTISAAIDDFLLDRESRNFSRKTLVQHRTSLSHLANFLETQHHVTHLLMIEAVHLRAWLVFLSKEPGIRGKPRIPRTTRTCRWYVQSMHAFYNWLIAEQYIEENPAERVELPKLEKPMIRIIEFEEFEKLLAACAARTGIKGKRVSAHIYRHTFAVRYLMLGGNIFSLQGLLEHEDISTIKNYMHLNDVTTSRHRKESSALAIACLRKENCDAVAFLIHL